MCVVTVTLNPAIDQSALAADFMAGEVNRVTWTQSDPGGKGVNVASFLSDLGFAASATGFIGLENAWIFEHLFQQKNIADHFVRIAGSTRVNVKIIDKLQNKITDINFPGQSPSEQNIAELKNGLNQLVANHDWFVLSGSLQKGVPAEYYKDLLKCLNAAGKRVVLDTSGEALRKAISEKPYAIKPNIDELEDLLGIKLTTQEQIVSAAKSLVSQGIQCVIISMGANGAIFVDAEHTVLAVPPSIIVKSTVGAGDEMVAGFIAAKIKGLSLQECARLATATAMGALTQFGPRLADASVLECYKGQISVREIVD